MSNGFHNGNKLTGIPHITCSIPVSNILSLKTMIYFSHLIVNQSDNLRYQVILIRFHNAWQTLGSLLLKRGVPLKIIQERLGNNSISVPVDIYAHIIPGCKFFDAAAAGKYNKMVSRRMDSSTWRGDRVAEGAALEILLIPSG
jgi:hypothetical protein